MTKKRGFIYALLSASLIISLSRQISCLASEDDIVSINLFNEKYYGTLSEQGKETVFTSLSDMDPYLTVCGTWKDSSFDGDCIISYEDGTTQSVTYSKQKISGEVTTKYSDGTSCVYSCSSGRQVGLIQYYDIAGNLTSKDWFHNSIPVRTLAEAAVEATYNNLSASPGEYANTPVKLSGIITDVFESNNQCYLILTDAQDNNYLLYYRNTEIKPNLASISVMENLSIGDSATIYGVFENIRLLSNTKKIFNSRYGYQSDFSTLKSWLLDSSKLSAMQELFPNNHPVLCSPMPVLNAFFCESEDTIKDPLLVPETYENICRYPLYFMNQETTLVGTVLYDTYLRKKKTILRVVESTSGEYYIVSEASSAFSSMVGEEISVQGIRKGNKKLPYLASLEIGYAIFPNIELPDSIN